MKNIVSNLLFVLFSVLFVNITNAQTFKKQKTNKERLTKKIRTESNIRSVDFSKDAKKYIVSPKKNPEKPKQLNRASSKIKMISPNTVVTNTAIRDNIKSGTLNDQQKRIKSKHVKDE